MKHFSNEKLENIENDYRYLAEVDKFCDLWREVRIQNAKTIDI